MLAYKVDLQQKAKGKVETNHSTHETPTQPKSTVASKTHITTESATSSNRVSRRCFRCQGLGHIASKCPDKRIVTLADFEVTENPCFADDPQHTCDIVEEMLGPDEGEILVVRRALSGNINREENQQREAIFHTLCTISNNVCSLIIDGGSCTNIASQTLVSKLELATEPHPSPYKIQWLNQGKGVHVVNRVLLSFTIGTSYKDEVWCDVVPMDVCHVLLGRPWMFDRRVTHDGYKNTYFFNKDGRKITLLPSTKTSISSPSQTLVAHLCFGSKVHDLDGFGQGDVEEKKAPATIINCNDYNNSGAAIRTDRGHDYKLKFRNFVPSLRTNSFEDGENDSRALDNLKLQAVGGVGSLPKHYGLDNMGQVRVKVLPNVICA